jgi:hypothetical protein
MIFRGSNPADGALLDFWLAGVTDPASVTLSIVDGGGETVARVPVEARSGQVNRAVWNLRLALGSEDEGEAPEGPPALPAVYTVRLEAGGEVSETPLVVRPDPREDIPADVRLLWTEELFVIQRLQARADQLSERADELLEARGEDDEEALEWVRQAEELRSRLRRLAGSVGSRVGPLTADETRQRDFLGGFLQGLEAELDGAGGV